MSLTEPSAEQALKLFKDVEELFPSKALGEERWYILLVSPATLATQTTYPPTRSFREQ